MSGRDTIPSSAIDLIDWGVRAPLAGTFGAPPLSRGAPRPHVSTQRQRERYSFVKTFVTSIGATISFMSINAFCIASQPALVE